LPIALKPLLKPRKTPIQARSSASVDAILQATLQVLTSVGKERLTTTRVAARAGVSVGTLYQYFPNKSALLQACLRLHMDHVRSAVETVCATHQGDGLLDMGTALIFAFLTAKMQNVKASAALYAVSSDIDGAAIAKASSHRARRAVVELFATAREPLTKDPEVIATVVLSAFNGVARSLLESKSPEAQLDLLRDELIVLVHAYLRTCIATAPLPKT
jgi:AcrR family transcriptional regulator